MKYKTKIEVLQLKSLQVNLYFINKFSKENNFIVDLFLGSGTTLIACEKTNRILYGCEIEPYYIDVIIQRYINYTKSTDNCYLIRDNEKISIKDIGFEVIQ